MREAKRKTLRLRVVRLLQRARQTSRCTSAGARKSLVRVSSRSRSAAVNTQCDRRTSENYVRLCVASLPLTQYSTHLLSTLQTVHKAQCFLLALILRRISRAYTLPHDHFLVLVKLINALELEKLSFAKLRPRVVALAIGDACLRCRIVACATLCACR